MRYFTRLYICTLVLFFISFFVGNAALAKANLDPKAIITVTHGGAKYIGLLAESCGFGGNGW